MKRVSAFIDGFNLYHSIEELKIPCYKWLNLKGLTQSYLKSDEILKQVYYFTSLTSWDVEKQLRHKKYIRALELTGVKVIYGKFKNKTQGCSHCGFKHKGREEKRTDVNIAVTMIEQAVKDEYDTALLFSGDTDLIPAFQSLKRLYPDKQIGIIFPMNRHTGEMEQAADFSDTLKEERIASQLLPERIKLPSGKFLTPPEEWK